MLMGSLAKRKRSTSPKMASESTELRLPSIPVPIKDFIPYLAENGNKPVHKALEPFSAYEAELRKFYAQRPDHEVLKDGLTNMVPLFNGHEQDLKIRARNLDGESEAEKEKYVMPLLDEERKSNGAPAVVTSLKEFQKNFNLFSESSLVELDWNNVVAAGSSVTTSLLPVPEKWAANKRSLREYYHEKLAPASDVDLFLYGLTEEEGLEKIKQIESAIKDSILHEVTTIRTKNAITIVSQYPTRHVQIVLRLYDSISQIITGFDVDCSCAAYDGKQVWTSPRALCAFSTQCNTVDLNRRSPSYENRLSKYSHRGFEVYWPELDRPRVDPTIFERSFKRTLGLARLLVLEKLPKSYDRETFADKRREERGRPAINRDTYGGRRLYGNIKDEEQDEVAEWVEEDQISNYHTMVVPYGTKHTASKILRLLYSKDLLLNAEWNRPKEREVNLHRHPCFLGTAEEVLEDCCGFCPEPNTDEELEVYEQESKIYVSGPLKFIHDDPGRQEVGSFNPVTTDDWTEMAYVGNTQMLCQAIIDGDLKYVRSWCEQEGNDPNTRDYVGRTPLHLATINGCTEVVKVLVDNGAKLVYRLLDGRSALNIAAQLGHIDIIKILMEKSLANEEEENEKADAKAREAKAAKASKVDSDGDSDMDKLEDDESDGASLGESETDSDDDSETQGFTMIKKDEAKPEASNDIPDDDEEAPDFYDINAPAWDLQCTPLHFAIMGGHIPVIRQLVEEYGADVLLPIKCSPERYQENKAVLPIVLAMASPEETRSDVIQTLLELGATTAQADMNHFTALHYIVESKKLDILDLLAKHDGAAAKGVLNLVSVNHGNNASTSLLLALRNGHEAMAKKLLDMGAASTIPFDDYIKAYMEKYTHAFGSNHDQNMRLFQNSCPQPVISAAAHDMPHIVRELVEAGSDVNELTTKAHMIIESPHRATYDQGHSLLDIVNRKIEQLKECGNSEKDRKEREEKAPVKPENLKDESYYLKGLEPGTYKYWVAQHRYKFAKAANQRLWDVYNRKPEDDKSGQYVLSEEAKAAKQAAADALCAEFEELQQFLLAKGSKTFGEMHPKLPEQDKRNRYGNYRQTRDDDYEEYITKFNFTRPTLCDNDKEGYFRLYEAVWKNDEAEVKALTLQEWKSEDGKMNAPLQVAVKDAIHEQYIPYDYYGKAPPPKKQWSFNGSSPFGLALLKENRKLAKVIVEIALAQYAPEDKGKKDKRNRWRLHIEEDCDGGHDSDGSDKSNQFVHFESEIVDDVYTIDNIAAIARAVKSTTTPLEMIQWNFNDPWFADNWETKLADKVTDMKDQNVTKVCIEHLKDMVSTTLNNYIIEQDDVSLLRFLYEIAETTVGQLDDSDIATASPASKLTEGLFTSAIKSGKTSLVAELIRTIGVPLSDLVKTSGVVISEEKPKYYQGLNIGGKKNKDWADAANPNGGSGYSRDLSKDSPPLLKAAKFGSLESIQWFLTDLPALEYLKFAESHPGDKRVRALSDSKGGFKAAIEKWLNTRADLVLHCALLAPFDDKDIPKLKAVLKYLLDARPELLEKRSLGGLTPLLLAAKCERPEIIKLLLEAGADPRKKDGTGRNVAHYIIQGHRGHGDGSCIKDRLDCFRRSDIEGMLLEADNDGNLPRGWYGFNLPEQKTVTEYQSRDLSMMSPLGEYPLHQAVKFANLSVAKLIVGYTPMQVGWENATGITPLEMAEMKVKTKIARESKDISSWYNDEFNDDEEPGVVVKDLRTFEPKPKEVEEWKKDKDLDEKERMRQIYQLLQKTQKGLQAKGEWKRRLVTLNEANEVTRRITAGNAKEVRAFAQKATKSSENGEGREANWDEVMGA